MKIDIEIEAARNIEGACDLPVRIAVGIGTAADQVGTGFARRDEQLFGAGIVEQALLREDADLQIDRPRIVALEATDGLETRQPDARVDLDMRAHARRALYDRLFERAAPARVNIALGEAALGGGDLRDRLLQRAVFRLAAVENAGLVEMDVGFDEARDDEAAAGVFARRVGGHLLYDLSDPAARDADIERAVAAHDARIAEDEIEHAIARPRYGRDRLLPARDPVRALRRRRRARCGRTPAPERE